MGVYNWPAENIQTTPGPIQFDLNGVDTEVSQDTAVPANSTPLPVVVLNPNGTEADPATETTLSAINTKTPALVSGRVPVDGSGVTQPISAASLPLPTGAATEATLAALNAKFNSLGQKTSANSAPVVLASDQSPIDTLMSGVVSTNNATTTPLGSGGTYTGTGDDLIDFEAVGVSIEVDRSGTLFLEYSQDNVTYYATFSYPITVAVPGTPEAFYYQAVSKERYFRIRYVNGGTAQGVFRVQCILRQVSGVGEVQAVGQALVGQESALVTKGVIYGLSSGGGGAYVAVKVSPSGSLETNATVTSSALPTGAATSANQSTLLTRVGDLTETAPGTDTASSGLNGRLQRIAQRLTSLIALFPTTIGQKNAAGSLSVVLASDATTPKQVGYGYADSIRKDYAAGSVTTGAWVQLIASTAAAAQGLTLFDSSGQTLELGIGAASNETRVLIIPPGGLNGLIPLAIPASTRLSVRALSATADVGELNITLLG